MKEGRLSESEDDEIRFLGSPEDECENLANDPDVRLLAACILNQQRAGFRNVIDLRKQFCPSCGAAGHNTGWGFWEFACGAEILNDPEAHQSEPCGCSQKGQTE